MTISDYDAEELAANILGFGEEYEPDEVKNDSFKWCRKERVC